MICRLLSIAMAAILLMAFANSASSQKSAVRDQNVINHERFRVTIWPEKTQIKVGEAFEVKLRLVNSSQEVQSFKVWNCSFPAQWQCNNSRIGSKEWMCFSNYLLTVELKPGEAYEKMLVMKVNEKCLSKTESFKMGVGS